MPRGWTPSRRSPELRLLGMGASPDHPTPLRNSYWVLPGSVLAGEHPGGANRDDTRERLKKLAAAGVECFIDLTGPGETRPYDPDLPYDVEYLRKPIRDHGIPAEQAHMAEILDILHDCVRLGRTVYVHCRAGIGRTGTVMGCFLIERGLSGQDALEELNHLWRECERSQTWSRIPETPEQAEYVLRWKARPGAPVQAAASSPVRAPASPPAPVPQAVAQPMGILSDAADPLLDPEALTAARNLRDRYLGALLGLAVGDAVAAATQYRRAGTFTPVGDMLGGGPFDLPRGGYSDDTAMALCLADSLLERNGFDARDQIETYRRWQTEGYLSATGQCVGITASTARAIARAQWRRQAFSGSHDPSQLDPEPLSRVAPAVMYFFGSRERAIDCATEAARTTCQAPVVLESCRTLARAVHAALSGQPKDAVLDKVSGRLRPAVRDSGVRGEVRHGGGAPAVLAAAVAAFEATDNFRDAVLEAANLGGDSDVVASVAGQLAGAHYTVNGIPTSWHNSLMNKELIASYADRLLAQALLDLGN